MIQDVLEPAVANFVQKSFEIISNQENGNIIQWLSSGREFIIKDTELFQSVILPRYFRHRNINSFIRQLNMYGFHKSRKDPTKNIFSHPNFVQGKAELLMNIKRKIKEEKTTDDNTSVQPTIVIKVVNQQPISQKIVSQVRESKPPITLSRQVINSRQHMELNIQKRQKQLQKTAIKPQHLSSLCQMDNNMDEFANHHINHKPVDWPFRSLIQKSQIMQLNPDIYNIKFENLTSLNHIDQMQFDFGCQQSIYHTNSIDDIQQQRKRFNNRMAGFNILQTINFMSQLNL